MSASGGAGGGFKPVYAPGPQDTLDGTIIGPITRDIMADPRQQLSLREGVIQGVGKAHRGVTYAHFEFRNYKRSYLGTTGLVTGR